MAADEFKKVLRDSDRNDPATEASIARLEKTIGVRLPLAYRELMNLFRG